MPNQAIYPAPPQPAKAPSRSLENLFGKNIVGIVASVLVFLGLIFLGFLVVPLLNDLMKVALMFILCAVLAVPGFLLNRRYNNNFTKALLGTGCGAFFIAIQMTHLYFNLLNDIVALVLLLAWLAAALLVMKQTQSLLMGVIAHVGMILSVCFGYTVALSNESTLLLLLAYQLVSTVFIVAGSILWCKKMYRFSLFASLAITVYASLFMWRNLIWVDPGSASLLPTIVFSLGFILQFICSCVLAYLLLKSIARVQNSSAQVILQLLNLLLWGSSLVANIAALSAKLYELLYSHPSSYGSFLAGTIAALIVIFAVLLLNTLLRKKSDSSQTLNLTTNLSLLAFSCLVLSINLLFHDYHHAAGPSLLLLALPALFCLLLRKLNNSQIYGHVAFILLLIDALYQLVSGFTSLSQFGLFGLVTGSGTLSAALSLVFPFIYLAILLGLSYLAYRQFGPTKSNNFKLAFKLTTLVFFELSLVVILWNSDIASSLALMELLCIAILLILHLTRQDTPKIFFRINEYLLYFLLSIEFSFNNLAYTNTLAAVFHLIAVAMALLLILSRIRLAAQANTAALRTPGMRLPNSDIEALSALAIHCLLLSCIAGLTNWFDQPYVLSLASMVIALLIIALGFWSRVRSLRLYGLVIVILCVLKLVLFDLGALNTIMRVVAFIGGGIICFGISALYNFAVKRFTVTQPAPAQAFVPSDGQVPGGFTSPGFIPTQQPAQPWEQQPEFVQQPAPHWSQQVYPTENGDGQQG
ncbi:MAG: DUF2339 domain-containing protein [Coriobacteriia bacterium]|nr:DUF2339 domain-containing protein [Coriobacteriia bacterium]